jgi:hypothetical protein
MFQIITKNFKNVELKVIKNKNKNKKLGVAGWLDKLVFHELHSAVNKHRST